MSLSQAQTDCRIWQRAKTRAGYGVFRDAGKLVYAHRHAYEQEVGPIPVGMELDHLCRNRACYNPEHLEPVTHAENMRRGHWGAKTECPKGHPYDEQNTRINNANGGRECLTCVRARKAAAYRAKNPEVKARETRTHCPQGHPYEGDNLMILAPSAPGRRPRRDCRECRRAGSLRRYYAKKQVSA